MKLRNLMMFCLLFLSGTQLMAQGTAMIVEDVPAREAFINFHKKQWDEFHEMKEHQGVIVATQRLVKNETREIARIEAAIYTSLTQVTNIISDIRSVVQIAQNTRDIFQYLYECDTITMSNPELLLIATDTKAVIVQRVADLGQYLALALTGGELNLMNNKDRLEFIGRVSTDIKVIKGYANWLRFELQIAVENGFWRSLFPGFFEWQNRLEYNARLSATLINSFTL